jgi:cell division protein FtsW
LGGILVVLLYLILLYRCGKIAKNCDDPYPAFLAMGIGMIIVMQALLHMYISVGNFVTGQPLPLLSQGGTSVIINCIYIGFVLSISRYANQKNKSTEAAISENSTQIVQH